MCFDFIPNRYVNKNVFFFFVNFMSFMHKFMNDHEAMQKKTNNEIGKPFLESVCPLIQIRQNIFFIFFIALV